MEFNDENDAIAIYFGAKTMRCDELMKLGSKFIASKLCPQIIWEAFTMAEDLKDFSLKSQCIQVSFCDLQIYQNVYLFWIYIHSILISGFPKPTNGVPQPSKFHNVLCGNF
jgi:hypothetical protein